MPKKTPRTTVTNPAASALPSQRGEFSPEVEQSGPIRPAQTPKSRQIVAVPGTVVITSKKGTR